MSIRSPESERPLSGTGGGTDASMASTVVASELAGSVDATGGQGDVIRTLGSSAPLVLRPDLLRGVVSSLSTDRFDSYRDTGDQEDGDVIARYAWNMAMCSALYPLLNVFEVTLGNRLFQLIGSRYPAGSRPHNTIPCWLDFTIPILTDREVRTVAKAKQRLPKPRNGQARHVTTSRLIAELTLDFWVFLFHEPYEKGHRGAGADLWPKMLKSVFPSMAHTERTMEKMLPALEEVRVFRNRVFHHEQIWKGNVLAEAKRLLSYTHAMQKDVGNLVGATEVVTGIVNGDVAAWRAKIAPLLT